MAQIFEYHPVFGYRFIPGVKARVLHEDGGYLVKANNVGFRCNRDFNTKNGTDKFRILVFGDSFTAGDGVSNSFRFTDLLEKYNDNLEVYNFGLPGSGTDQQYLIFKEYAANTSYDLIIINVLVENIRRIVSHYRNFIDGEGNMKIFMKPYFAIDNGGLILKNVPPDKEPIDISKLDSEERRKIDFGGRFPQLRNFLIKNNYESIFHKLTRWKPYPEYDKENNDSWQLMKSILKDWVSFNNKKIVIVPFPHYYYTEGLSDPVNYLKRFSELGKESNCDIWNPLPYFNELSLQERRKFRFEKDVHPTKYGHEVFSNYLRDKINSFMNNIKLN
ncbi:MAG: SGNH/GDSL hydrolase family protein [Ignavibacteriae bacterium]|nr:SGNH/GDSL hydrolase family protein [Ignavibacteriota bacterium]